MAARPRRVPCADARRDPPPVPAGNATRVTNGRISGTSRGAFEAWLDANVDTPEGVWSGSHGPWPDAPDRSRRSRIRKTRPATHGNAGSNASSPSSRSNPWKPSNPNQDRPHRPRRRDSALERVHVGVVDVERGAPRHPIQRHELLDHQSHANSFGSRHPTRRPLSNNHVVRSPSAAEAALDRQLRALADLVRTRPIRRDIVVCSLGREWSIGELARRIQADLDQPPVPFGTAFGVTDGRISGWSRVISLWW